MMTRCNQPLQLWLSTRNFGCILLLLHAGSAYCGQVVVDNSFGHGGALAGPTFAIPSTLGRQAGTNLFHSFSSFGLDAGDTATFFAPAATQNILVRVTGNSPSAINGTIASRVESSPSSPHPASFYFINPSGVVFGPDARLDVGGSFAVTTADAIRLADGGVFQAKPLTPGLLTSAAPSAFGFLARSPGGITIAGASAASPVGLGVPAGKSILVVAGPVTITNGILAAPGGRVVVATAAAPGDIRIDLTATDIASSPAPANIDLSGSLISVDGAPSGSIDLHGAAVKLENGSALDSINSGATAGGSITINAAGTLSVVQSSSITTASQGAGAAGGIGLTALNTVLGSSDVADLASVSSDSGAGAVATGGTVQLNARTAQLSGSALLGSSTSGPAAAANIAVSATSVSLADQSGIRSSTSGSGASGAIDIQCSQLQLAGNTRVATVTSGTGAGGAVQITAGTVTTVESASIFTVTDGLAPGGDITVSADEIDLLGLGGGIETSSLATQAGGKGGNITLNGRKLQIEGGATASVVSNNDAGGGNLSINVDQILVSGIDSSIQDAPLFGTGGGGSLNIKATTLDLEDQARITTQAFGPANGGPISIAADQVHVRGGSEISAGAGFAGAGTGNAGPISLVAQQLTIDGNSNISSSTDGFGLGGKITVDTPQITLTGGSSISASASAAGDGGSVVVRSDAINLSGGSDLFAFTTGAGNGGDITVDAANVFATDPGSGIRAPTAVIDGQGRSGNGGNVHVVANALTLQNSASIITSTGAVRSDGSIDNANSTDVTGRAGNIEIEAARILLTGGTADNPSGISAQTIVLTPGTGAGGDIRIRSSSDLKVLAGARINASSAASAAGGSISINGGKVQVSGGRSIIESAATGTGDAGSVQIKAARQFLLQRHGQVGVSALTSSGGDLSIDGGQRLVASSGLLTAESGGIGGNIQLRANSLIDLTNSTVTARAGSDGGRVRIDPPVFTLKNTTIDARSGGLPVTVQIDAAAFLNSRSRILTNTGITFPETNIAGSLLALHAQTLEGTARLQPQCGVKYSAEISSFVVTGRGGQPPEAGTWIPDLTLDPARDSRSREHLDGK